MKQDLKSMTLAEMQEAFVALGEPKFRAKQVFTWLHRGATCFDEMTNLSKPLREKLDGLYFITAPRVARKQVSKLDGTIKYLWQLGDGNCVESVVMQYHHGNTVCISSEVGCPMGCKFCASTLGGLVLGRLFFRGFLFGFFRGFRSGFFLFLGEFFLFGFKLGALTIELGALCVGFGLLLEQLKGALVVDGGIVLSGNRRVSHRLLFSGRRCRAHQAFRAYDRGFLHYLRDSVFVEERGQRLSGSELHNDVLGLEIRVRAEGLSRGSDSLLLSGRVGAKRVLAAV